MAHGSIYLNSHICSNGVKYSANFVAFIKSDQNYYLTGFGYARCKGYQEWHPSVLPECEGKSWRLENIHFNVSAGDTLKHVAIYGLRNILLTLGVFTNKPKMPKFTSDKSRPYVNIY